MTCQNTKTNRIYDFDDNPVIQVSPLQNNIGFQIRKQKTNNTWHDKPKIACAISMKIQSANFRPCKNTLDFKCDKQQ